MYVTFKTAASAAGVSAAYVECTASVLPASSVSLASSASLPVSALLGSLTVCTFLTSSGASGASGASASSASLGASSASSTAITSSQAHACAPSAPQTGQSWFTASSVHASVQTHMGASVSPSSANADTGKSVSVMQISSRILSSRLFIVVFLSMSSGR